MADENMTIEQAKEMLRQQEKENVGRCWQAIKAVCKQFGCTLVSIPRLTSDGRIESDVFVRNLQSDE